MMNASAAEALGPGNSTQAGHTFGYFGSSIWAPDVLAFLEKHCASSQPQ